MELQTRQLVLNVSQLWTQDMSRRWASDGDAPCHPPCCKPFPKMTPQNATSCSSRPLHQVFAAATAMSTSTYVNCRCSGRASTPCFLQVNDSSPGRLSAFCSEIHVLLPLPLWVKLLSPPLTGRLARQGARPWWTDGLRGSRGLRHVLMITLGSCSFLPWSILILQSRVAGIDLGGILGVVLISPQPSLTNWMWWSTGGGCPHLISSLYLSRRAR